MSGYLATFTAAATKARDNGNQPLAALFDAAHDAADRGHRHDIIPTALEAATYDYAVAYLEEK